MAQFQLNSGSSFYDIHPEWAEKWGIDITDPKLKEAIWIDSRFSHRICDRILGKQTEFSDVVEADLSENLKLDLVLEHSQEAILLELGIRWLAPIVAPNVLNRGDRNKVGELNRDQMKTILEYKDHVTPDVIDAMPDPQNYHIEGLICIDAWLSSFCSATATRAKLAFPPAIPSASSQRRHRVAICNRALSDLRLSGGES